MNIMIVDDDISVTMALQEILRTRGHNVRLHNDSTKAIDDFKNSPSDVVLTDLNMPMVDGFKLIDELKQIEPTVDIVVITGYPSTDNAVKAMKMGAYDFIRKPFQADEIDALLERINQRRLLLNRLSNIRDEVVRLEEIKRRLEVLNQLKDNFIGNISHELRTPLNIMINAISLLRSKEFGAMPDIQKRLIDMIDSGIRRLNNTIEGIFDLTFGDRYKKQCSEFVLDDIIDSILMQFEEDITKKGLVVRKDIDIKGSIISDKKIVERILYHLISNAIKFNKNGGQINISAIKDDRVIEIKIQDTGIGIPESEKERIFDRFYQVDSSITREYGGAGIGLSAVRKYVDTLGGKVSVNSQVGVGSTFIVRIPL